MERKVILYNSNDIKIGETFPRRAQQLVRRQRAAWIDDGQTAIRFYPNMENMDDIPDDPAPQINELQINQLYFARWRDGYYYPGVIRNISLNHANVDFLDDDSYLVEKQYVVPLQMGFEMMEFQGCWEGMFFYDGVLTSTQPLIFNYYDGYVEHIALKHLRGIMPERV